MDISTIVGILIGFAVMVWGIGLDKLQNFMDPQSAIIVVGGAAAALIASYPFSVLKQVPKHLKIIMQGSRYDPVPCIEKLIELSEIARKNGLLALEDKAAELDDPFFRTAVLSIADYSDAEKLRKQMTDQIENMSERHAYYIGMYEKGSAMSPAFGMVGTLIGLINMLKSMNLDDGGSSALGEGMSIALVTTLYGVIVANLIYGPVAKKLSRRDEEECLYKQIIVESVLAIQNGENPKALREELYALLEDGKKQEKKTPQTGESGIEQAGTTKQAA